MNKKEQDNNTKEKFNNVRSMERNNYNNLRRLIGYFDHDPFSI